MPVVLSVWHTILLPLWYSSAFMILIIIIIIVHVIHYSLCHLLSVVDQYRLERSIPNFCNFVKF